MSHVKLAGQETTEQRVFTVIQNIIAEIMGVDPEEVDQSTALKEFTLQLGPIIGRINTHYKIYLTRQDVVMECETIEDLVGLVVDEVEYESDDDEDYK